MYCTQQDIEKQVTTPTLIQLTSDDSQDVVNETIAFEAILYSSTLIDGYLRGRYNLPLDTHFPLLRIIAIDLSIYRLYSRRLHADMPEAILEQYKEAIKTLEKIQKGIITLEVQTEASTNQIQSKEYLSNKTSINRQFNHEVMSEY